MVARIVNIAGAETEGFDEVSIVGDTPTIEKTVVSGAGSLASYRLDTSGDEISYPFFSDATISPGGGFTILGFKFQIAALPSSETQIIRVEDGTTIALRFFINSSGDLILKDSLSSVIRTMSAAISVDTWYRIEVYWQNSGSGNIEVFIDSVSQGNDASQDMGPITLSVALTQVIFKGLSATEIQYIDDIYSMDGAANTDRLSNRGGGVWTVIGYQPDITGTTPDEGGGTLDAGDYGNVNDTPVADGNTASYTASAAATGLNYCNATNSGGLGSGPSGDSNITGTIDAAKWLWRLNRSGGGPTTHFGRGGKRTTAPSTTSFDSADLNLTTGLLNYNRCFDDTDGSFGIYVPGTTDFICVGFGKSSGGQDLVCSGYWATVLHVTAASAGFVDIDSAISQSLSIAARQNNLRPVDASISQSLSIAARQNVIRPIDALLSSSVSVSAMIGANFPLDAQVNLSLAVTGEISRLESLFSQIDMSLAVNGEIDKLIGLYSDLVMSLAVSGALNAPINLDGLISQALTIGAEASRLRSLDALSASALTLAARLNTLRPIDASISQSLSVDASQNVIRPLSSSIDTTLSLAGELGPIRGLNSDVASSLDVQAELGPLRGLASTVPAALSMGAALGATFDFNSAISLGLTVNGNFSRLRSINTSIGLSLVIGSELDVVPAGAVFVDFDGSLSQSLVLGSSLNIIRPIYASIDQSLTVNADVNLLQNLVSQIVMGLTVAGELSTAASIDLASQIALALSISALVDNQTGFSATIQSSLLTIADLNVLTSFHANFNFQSGVNARLGAVFDISGSIDSSLVFDGTLSCFIGLNGDVQCSLMISGSRENLAGLFGSVDFILTSQADASCIVGMWGSIDQAMSLIGELEGVSDIVYEIGRSSVRIIQRGGNSSSRIAKGGGITSGTE